jgi:hypothetical protein
MWPLAPFQGRPRLGKRLAHEQLVVHGADHTGRRGAAAVPPAAGRACRR